MSAHVVIHPSGHEYLVEGSDTLLDAALRAGLAVGYGCSNGNCGLCKARVVSGQVRKVRPHDYMLSEAEKQQGYTLLCSNAAVSDLVIEVPEITGVGEIPLQQIVARVKALEPLCGDVMLLHLQTPRHSRLRFLAGQNATLTAGGISAQLPIASCPCDERNLHFHVVRDEQDAFSRQVFHALKTGDAISVFGPLGDFVLRAGSPRPILFVAGDAGFAPIKALIEHALSLGTAELHLYWQTAQPADHYLANLCRAWADALGNFRYSPVGGDGGAEALVRRIRADRAELSDFDLYLAGPEGFVNAAERALREQGFPEAQMATAVV